MWMLERYCYILRTPSSPCHIDSARLGHTSSLNSRGNSMNLNTSLLLSAFIFSSCCSPRCFLSHFPIPFHWPLPSLRSHGDGLPASTGAIAVELKKLAGIGVGTLSLVFLYDFLDPLLHLFQLFQLIILDFLVIFVQQFPSLSINFKGVISRGVSRAGGAIKARNIWRWCGSDRLLPGDLNRRKRIQRI